MKDYPSNKSCPCKSGKTYGKCCKKKGLFALDNNGAILQRVNYSREAQRILKKRETEFFEFFGRTRTEGDPVFFHDLLKSEDDHNEGLTELFSLAGLPEDKLYACKKTGYILSETNKDIMPDKVIKEWKAAIKEFHDIKNGKVAIEKPPIIESLEFLQKELYFSQYLFGLIIYKQNNLTKTLQFDKAITPRDYVLFCVTKNLKSLRAAILLIEKNFGEDALNLIRSIFENYLHISMCIHHDDFLYDVKLKIGILTGTHRYNKKGSDKVIEIKTGETFRLKYKRGFDLASNHPKHGANDSIIFDYLYEYLSSYTHPDLMTISNYIDQEGLNHTKRNQKSESVLYIGFLNLLILNELKNFPSIDEVSRKDIDKFKDRLYPHFVCIFSEIEKENSNFPNEFIKRIENL